MFTRFISFIQTVKSMSSVETTVNNTEKMLRISPVCAWRDLHFGASLN